MKRHQKGEILLVGLGTIAVVKLFILGVGFAAILIGKKVAEQECQRAETVVEQPAKACR